MAENGKRPLSPEDWERIKELFSSALGLPAGERTAWLAAAWPDNPEGQAAVAELLAAHVEASSSFLDPAGLVFDQPWLFKAGERLAGRFRVVRTIGRGATGEVYEVHDERLDQRIALKALRAQLVGDRLPVERLRREALVTREIAHEGLCRTFDLVDHTTGPGSALPEGTLVPCLTMQLLEGESLEDYLETHRPMTPAEALPLLRQIIATLDELHAHGVIHRDLKPSNVMLIERGGERRAVLTDFGLAKPLDESLFETEASVQGGAPYFMAPELFKGQRPSRASDIYALGLLIDEMVTTERAFSAGSLPELMMRKLKEGPIAPSARSTSLPPAWDHTILRCLSRHPRDRFRRARDIGYALESAPSLSAWVPSWVKRFGRSRAWRWIAITGATTVALAGALATQIPGPTSASVRSVVVLPFVNRTGDAGNDYLSIGTSSELGRRLTTLPDLSVYTTRDPASPDPVALEQRAAFTLRGQVQNPGGYFRITVELVERPTSKLLWSANFDGPREESLQLQEAIAEDASGALIREIAKAEGGLKAFTSLFPYFRQKPDPPTGGTTNNEAYDAYYRARQLSEDRSSKSTRAAVALLRRASELDPNYAAPHALLADLQAVLMDLHEAPHDQLLAEAQRQALEAVRLAPDFADAQLSLAAVRQMQYRWDDAEKAFQETLRLHPTHARAHRWYGGMLLQRGRFAEALRLIERGLQLDPYDYPSHSAYGLALFYARRPPEAVTQLETLLQQKDHIHAHLILGQVYAYLTAQPGDARQLYFDRALRESTLLRAMELKAYGNTGKTDYADFVAALAWSYRGNVKKAAPFVGRLEADYAAGRTSPSFLSRIYAVQNRRPEFFSALDATEAQGDRELMYVSVSPLYDRVRDDPRMAALVKRLGLVP